MQTANTTSFSLARDAALRAAQRTQALAALALHTLNHPEVRRAYNALAKALGADDTPWMQASSSGNDVNICFTLRNLDSFKDERLVRALAPFAGVEGWEASTQDWTHHQPNRDYTFTRTLRFDDGSAGAALTRAYARTVQALAKIDGLYGLPTQLTLRVAVYAYVKTDSATCRIVVKGTTERIVREEVKEIVCE